MVPILQMGKQAHRGQVPSCPRALAGQGPAEAGSLTDCWSMFSPFLCPHGGQEMPVWCHLSVPARLC